jgi:hypothetical protein
VFVILLNIRLSFAYFKLPNKFNGGRVAVGLQDERPFIPRHWKASFLSAGEPTAGSFNSFSPPAVSDSTQARTTARAPD